MKSEHTGSNNNGYDFQHPQSGDVIMMASNLLTNGGNNPDEYYLCRESDPLANGGGGDKILMVNLNKKPITEAMNSAKLIFTNLKIEVMLISHGKLFKIK